MTIGIRDIQEKDLPDVDRVVRIAFGTWLGVPDPPSMFGDAELARCRWRCKSGAGFVATDDRRIIGSSFLAHWGSAGFFGPLTVDPDYWDRGVGQRLLEATVDQFSKWNLSLSGLFTFAQSSKHVSLYQKFDFWPRYLTMFLSRPAPDSTPGIDFELYSGNTDQPRLLAEAHELTNDIYPGLDLTGEIEVLDQLRTGDTVLIRRGTRLAGFAVCHAGAGSEAGSGVCHAKFGAVRPGPEAGKVFDRLLDACGAYAKSAGARKFRAGVNTARTEAYRAMLAKGFRADMQGIQMLKGGMAGYSRPGVYVLDDWA